MAQGTRKKEVYISPGAKQTKGVNVEPLPTCLGHETSHDPHDGRRIDIRTKH